MVSRSISAIAAAAALVVAAAGTALSPVSAAPERASAPRAAPQTSSAKSRWTEGDKTAFGTSRTLRSNVWFTARGGALSEVFYPNLSTPSVRSLELVVVGAGFVDRPAAMSTVVSRPDPSSLRFQQISTDPEGRYRLTQTFVTDPARPSVVVRVRLESLDGGTYRLFALYDPALDNSGMNDRGRTSGRGLAATDGRVSSMLVARPSFVRLSSGLAAHRSDPFRDLGSDGDLDRARRFAGPGNVVQLGRLAGAATGTASLEATLTLGFGGGPARAAREARATRRIAGATVQARYDSGWHRYVGTLRDVPASAAAVRPQYLASVLVLAAAEDKRHRGAFIASPSAPWVWGDEVRGLSSPSGAYHLVWSRDAYQFGTALWAAGDRAAARRMVRWLFGTQQRRNGSFPQNSDVAGRPVWGSLQLDEVALPIALARLVGMRDRATWRGVERAARFLVSFRDQETRRRAPFTTQERWENQSGYSPNSIAAQVVALICAADLAQARGRPQLARQWRATADLWQRNVKRWTVTTNGPLSGGPYFLRLTKDGHPNRATTYAMGDGGPRSIDQRRVVDPSFLDLVRLGVLPAADPAVVNTLGVVDAGLQVTTPNGPFWHRFNHDGYGETRTGGQWVITDPGADLTLGRAWPLLTGERGEYAVTAGLDATPYLAAMAAASGPSDMLAEQVWDGRPPTGDPCCPAGEGTRSATPLVWSHAQLVRLAWSMQAGRPVDQQAVVANRYLG